MPDQIIIDYILSVLEFTLEDMTPEGVSALIYELQRFVDDTQQADAPPDEDEDEYDFDPDGWKMNTFYNQTTGPELAAWDDVNVIRVHIRDLKKANAPKEEIKEAEDELAKAIAKAEAVKAEEDEIRATAWKDAHEHAQQLKQEQLALDALTESEQKKAARAAWIAQHKIL